MFDASRHAAGADTATAREVGRLLSQARRVASSSARTFSVAMRLLPAHLHADVQLMYLVARTLDDLVDERRPEVGRRLDAVERWALTGGVHGSEALILEHLAGRHPGLPRDAVIDFCEGMRTDLTMPRFETERELDRYSYQVAGTIGRLMAGILGTRRPEADSAARALGIAMQRTNILRDIDEDLARGRVCMPASTLETAGIRDLRMDDRTRVLEVSTAIADLWYERGLAGIPELLNGRTAIRAAALMYREILRQIGRDGWGARRPWRSHVSPVRKSWLVLRAAVSR